MISLILHKLWIFIILTVFWNLKIQNLKKTVKIKRIIISCSNPISTLLIDQRNHNNNKVLLIHTKATSHISLLPLEREKEPLHTCVSPKSPFRAQYHISLYNLPLMLYGTDFWIHFSPLFSLSLSYSDTTLSFDLRKHTHTRFSHMYRICSTSSSCFKKLYLSFCACVYCCYSPHLFNILSLSIKNNNWDWTLSALLPRYVERLKMKKRGLLSFMPFDTFYSFLWSFANLLWARTTKKKLLHKNENEKKQNQPK